MKHFWIFLLSFLFLTSCIPLRIAPNISDYSVVKGKKFKRTLPKREMFIFQDPKDANMFYAYVDTKFGLNNVDVYDNVPFLIDGTQYFFSYYETQISDKTLNMFPIIADVFLNIALGNDEIEPIISNTTEEVIRKGNWYIAIEVYSDQESDCLQKNSLSRGLVLKYLSNLKKEYLSTHNYNELVFKN